MLVVALWVFRLGIALLVFGLRILLEGACWRIQWWTWLDLFIDGCIYKIGRVASPNELIVCLKIYLVAGVNLSIQSIQTENSLLSYRE